MQGTLTRVLGVYPVAFPVIFSLLVAAYPGTFSFDQETGVYSVHFTMAQMLSAFGGAYAVILGVFAKWGIKK